MVSLSRSIKFLSLTIAAWTMLIPSAISGPVVSVPSLSFYQANRFARDLTRSPSEDFFREGRLKLEQEIQLTRKRQLLSEDILKVSPDQRKPQDFVPSPNPQSELRDH